MKKIILFLCLCSFCFTTKLHAQELSARVNVNSDKLQGTDKSIFTSMQNALTALVNGTKWSSATFAPAEKIECTFGLILTGKADGADAYTGEITVTARRPVYNSSYTTPLINFRDTKVEFEYTENMPLEYIETSITNNLVAVFAFYSYIILGLDFDSFAPMGGSYFYRQAERISNTAQSTSWTGWETFGTTMGRGALINALSDESLTNFREMWYTYHRKGLDEMAANADRSRTTIIGVLPALQQVYDTRSSNVLLQLFADSKLDETVAICTKASTEEKKEIYEMFNKLYPTLSSRLEPLKK